MSASLCIAIDASSLLTRHPRGEGRSLLRLYEEIARIRPHWRFVFFGMRNSDAAEEIRRRIPNSVVRVFEIPGYRWNLWMNLGLPLAAWLSGAKLLHCSSSGAPPWSPVPVVMTAHDVIPLLMDDGLSPAAVEGFRRGLLRGIRCARRIIAVSESTRRDLIRLMQPDTKKLSVIHWGIDVDHPAIEANGHKDLVLGFGGGGSLRKNTPMLVRMFGRIAAARPSSSLLVLGVSDPKQREELNQLVAQLSIQDRVTLSGYVTDDELEEHYRQAACLVYVSLYEGFGLPPLEAMAHGVPVVASNCSSIPEVVGDAGLLVDPADTEQISTAVLDILNDKGLRQRLSEQSVRRALHFEWQATARKTADVFEDALAI